VFSHPKLCGESKLSAIIPCVHTAFYNLKGDVLEFMLADAQLTGPAVDEDLVSERIGFVHLMRIWNHHFNAVMHVTSLPHKS